MKRFILILVLLISAFYAMASDTTQTKVINLQLSDKNFEKTMLDSLMQQFSMQLEKSLQEENIDLLMRKFEESMEEFEKSMEEFEKKYSYLDTMDFFSDLNYSLDSLELYIKTLDDTDSLEINDKNKTFQYNKSDQLSQLLNNTTSILKTGTVICTDLLRELVNFTPFILKAGGAFQIIYTPTDSLNEIKISGDPKMVNLVSVVESLENGKPVVEISFNNSEKKVTSYSIPTIYVNANNLDEINISGAANFKTSTPIEAKKFKVNASGASTVSIDGLFDNLITHAEGAANVVYSGHAKNHLIETDGASNVIASKQTNDTATLSASGVSKIRVYVKDKITEQNCQSYASIVVLGKPETYTDKDVTIVYTDKNGSKIYHTQDSSTFKFLGVDFTKYDDKHYEIGVGSYALETDGKSTKIKSRKGKKFNGHWGGIELGINGYNTPNFNMDFPKEYDFMDLQTSKSVTFHLNLIEFNIPFNKKGRLQKWGMVTGLGYEVYNYRLQSNVFLCPDSSTLKGYIIEGGLPVKSKLVVDYLTVPILFEFQNKRFHVGLGGIFGVRLTTHSKNKFENPDEEVVLKDPITGKAVATLTPDKKIYKQHDDFHLSPIKLNARFSIGYSIFNVFVDYSVLEMFRANRGPELYPWTVGITLLGW